MKQATPFTVCLLLVGNTFLQSCDWTDPTLTAVNNSDRTVYITYSEQQIDKGELSSFPPYSIDEHGKRVRTSRRSDSSDERTLWPHTSRRLERVNDYWESYLARDSIMFFVLDAFVVDSLNWSEIRNKNLYVKKFRLPLDSAKRLNWKITFN